MAGGICKRRNITLQALYKRVKYVIINDPDITANQLHLRFNITYPKIKELRKEVEDANKNT